MNALEQLEAELTKKEKIQSDLRAAMMTDLREAIAKSVVTGEKKDAQKILDLLNELGLGGNWFAGALKNCRARHAGISAAKRLTEAETEWHDMTREIDDMLHRFEALKAEVKASWDEMLNLDANEALSFPMRTDCTLEMFAPKRKLRNQLDVLGDEIYVRRCQRWRNELEQRALKLAKAAGEAVRDPHCNLDAPADFVLPAFN